MTEPSEPGDEREPAGYGPATYGDSFADVYDDWYADVTDADATAHRIRALAGAGSRCGRRSLAARSVLVRLAGYVYLVADQQKRRRPPSPTSAPFSPRR